MAGRGKKTAGRPETLIWYKIIKFKSDTRVKTFKELEEKASN